MSSVPDHAANLEILRAACCVAAQDGHVSPKERPLIDRLAQRAGVGNVSLDAMIEMAEDDPDFSRRQFEVLQTDPVPTIRALAEVAMVDGDSSGKQRAVLEAFAHRLGIDDDRLQDILDETG